MTTAYEHCIYNNVIAVTYPLGEKVGRSITNDAENVIEELSAKYDLNYYRIIHQDSQGKWDEWVLSKGKLQNFRLLDETTLERALAKLGA